MEKLKSYPFCGGTAYLCGGISGTGHDVAIVKCHGCHSEMHSTLPKNAKQAAVTAWNTRKACEHAQCIKIKREYGVVPCDGCKAVS